MIAITVPDPRGHVVDLSTVQRCCRVANTVLRWARRYGRKA